MLYDYYNGNLFWLNLIGKIQTKAFQNTRKSLQLAAVSSDLIAFKLTGPMSTWPKPNLISKIWDSKYKTAIYYAVCAQWHFCLIP
jgi:hypothetical protein